MRWRRRERGTRDICCLGSGENILHPKKRTNLARLAWPAMFLLFKCCACLRGLLLLRNCLTKDAGESLEGSVSLSSVISTGAKCTEVGAVQ